MPRNITSLRVFLQSADDVAEERDIAFNVIEGFANLPAYREKVVLLTVELERIGSGNRYTAQNPAVEVEHRGLTMPEECDLVIIIMNSRIGQPFRDQGGIQHESPMHWVFHRATSNKNIVTLVFNCAVAPKITMDDPQRDLLLNQYDRVSEFLASDELAGKTDLLNIPVCDYGDLAEFEQQFKEYFGYAVNRILEDLENQKRDDKSSRPINENQQHIFLSYSRADADIVESLVADLRDYGMSIWTDVTGLEPGTLNWEEALRDAIANCSVVLLAASPNSRKSNFVTDEIEIARLHNRPVIPLWIRGDAYIDSIQMGMGRTQYIDARGQSYDSAIHQLVELFSETDTTTLPPHLKKQENDGYDIVITYSRDMPTEKQLALELNQYLVQQSFKVYATDQSIRLGIQTAEYLKKTIHQSQFLIALISKSSASSEVLREHLEIASIPNPQSSIRILPIRIKNYDEFPYHLQPYLDHVSWAIWDDPTDTARVMSEMINAINGDELPIRTISQKYGVLKIGAQTAKVAESAPEIEVDPNSISKRRFELPRGTMNPNSEFYISRKDIDDRMEREIVLGGVTVVIRAPRQMGKSSLLLRAHHMAREVDKQFIFVDMQQFTAASFQNENLFFKTFCRLVAEQIFTDISPIEQEWQQGRTSIHQTTNYFERVLLPAIEQKELFLALDEVDRIYYAYDCPFRSDFFGMLRHWHNRRGHPNSSYWGNLSLILSISTEPNLLIEDKNQSPFNVGEIIQLTDFDINDVKELNFRYGMPFDKGSLNDLYSLVGGHPYLTREAMYQVATNRVSVDLLLDDPLNRKHPFQDHLSHFLYILSGNNALVDTFLDIIDGKIPQSQQDYARLETAGLVSMNNRNEPQPRCKLYRLYFDRYLRKT